MKFRYPRWLKRFLLPFEDPAHPLYAEPAEMQELQRQNAEQIAERERWENLSPEEQEAEMEAEDQEWEEPMRQAFGEGFVQQLRRAMGKE